MRLGRTTGHETRYVHVFRAYRASSKGEKQTSKEQEESLPLNWMKAMKLLYTILGINARAAQGIITEIGTDMGRFQSARHLASWGDVSGQQ